MENEEIQSSLQYRILQSSHKDKGILKIKTSTYEALKYSLFTDILFKILYFIYVRVKTLTQLLRVKLALKGKIFY